MRSKGAESTSILGFRWVAVLAVLPGLFLAPAGAESRRAELNERVLDAVASTVELFFLDKEGPEDWSRRWAQARSALREEPESCRFYRGLQDVLDGTGVSHFSVSPPEDEETRHLWRCVRALRTVRIGERRFVRTIPEGMEERGLTRGAELLEVAGLPVEEYGESWGCGTSRLDLVIQAPDGEPRHIDFNGWQPPEPELPIMTGDLPGGIVYLRVASFGDGYRHRELAERMGELKGASGMVVDLRGNRGGSVGHVLELLSLFLVDDFVMGTNRPRTYPSAMVRHLNQRLRAMGQPPFVQGRERVMRVAGRRDAYRGPVRALIDHRCASAAELAAFVFQKSGRAPLIGERTSGQVLQGLSIELPDGGRLHIPVASFEGLTVRYWRVRASNRTSPSPWSETT